MEILKIIITAFGSIIVLFILTKIMGDREMSELSMFDYITSITIGSIASEMAIASNKDELMRAFISMIVYGLITAFIAFITCKSIILRRFFEGHPVLLYKNGQIYEKNLLKTKLDIDEFLAMLRVSGYFDLEEIHTIILEANGRFSIIPKSKYRPVTPNDLNLAPQQNDSLANVIIDGRILDNNLKFTGKDEKWVHKQLSAHGVSDINEVILANYDVNKNKLNIYLKVHEKNNRDIFE